MTQVIIDDIIPRTQLVATAGQTVFNTNWTADATTDIDVYARADGVEPDDETQLVSPSLYDVTFIGGSETVRVTFLSGRTLDDVITIVRNTPSERMNLYVNTNFVPSMLNQDFGILTLVDQQAQMYDTVVAPHYNVSATIDPIIDVVLPILEENQIWAMNGSRTSIIPYNVPESGGLAPSEATYLLQTANSDLPNAQVLGSLASGFVINTTTTGVQLSRVLQGTTDQIDITNTSGIAGNPVFSISDNPIIPGSESMIPPKGTTAQRPGSLTAGQFRFNTDLTSLEVYTGAVWDQLAGGVVDTITGTANQIDVDNTDPLNPILSLSSTLDAPGTFTIQNTIDLDSIIDDDTFVTATDTNIPTSESVKAYVDTTLGGYVLSVSGTTNQVDIDNTDPQNPIVELSSTLDLPGTFTIQSSTAVDEIINDSTLASATSSNIATASAIKTYVDSLVTGLNIQGSCVCASTVALTVTYANGASGVGATLTNAGAMAAISLDGVSPTVGQRVLIKNQASSLQNGIYTVTTVGSGAVNWVLTRATDYDQPSEIAPGDLVVITGGTVQNQSSWLQTATVATVGTDAVTFVQFTASLPVNVASGGTGVTTFNAYEILAGGLTSTGSLQQIAIGSLGQLLQSQGAGALAAYTTATYPSTVAVNTILFGSASNVIGAISATARGVLVSDNSSVPSMLASASTTGQILQGSTTGAPTWSTATYPSTSGTSGTLMQSNGTNFVNTTATYPGTSGSTGTILRSNGTNWVNSTSTFADTYSASTLLYSNGANTVTGLATANNGILVTSAGGVPSIGNTVGAGLTMPSITFNSTTGVVGTTTNDSAAAGSVGELIESEVLIGSAVSATSGAILDVTSISLTAGDWDVFSTFATAPAAGTTTSQISAWGNTTSVTAPTAPNKGLYVTYSSAIGAGAAVRLPCGQRRLSLSGTTTVYLSGVITFAVSTMGAYGYIGARRVR
jgi:hypothetical protein